MPAAIPHEDDDPVIASYDVYITNPLPKFDGSATEDNSASRLFVLQYPSHRPLTKPYNAARSQKPTRLRLKPHTGIVEVEVPILTQEHFNAHAGEKYGQALSESRVFQLGGSHGLGGGFASGPLPQQNLNLNDIPVHGGEPDQMLQTQTLGGKIVSPCERDPVYMLGSFQNNELHLTHLDAVVQMRPQLHHIDAEEEINQKTFQTNSGFGSKVKAGFEAAPTKLESKAIEIKMKDNKEDPKDRNLNVNARLLRDIRADQWRSHDWVDEDDQEAWQKAAQHTTLAPMYSTPQTSGQLRSIITNDDWLDKMSVPREDGKKGLRAKLKGRDRERARRKKVESQRRELNTGQSHATARTIADSDSEPSSLSEHSDADMAAGPGVVVNQVDIKQEPSNSLAAAPVTVPSVPDSVLAESAPKRRGRPRKN